MKNAQKKTANGERIIQALEGLIADYRAGRGDVLNRLVNDQQPDFEAGTLGTALTAALFGNAALPKPTVDGSSVLCNKREHLALCAIGAGSAERGAAQVVHAAQAWAKRDRAGMVAWASSALPKLVDALDALNRVKARGLFGVEAWEIPVAVAGWFPPVHEVASAAVKGDVMADAVVRAMALDWNRRGFPGRVAIAEAA